MHGNVWEFCSDWDDNDYYKTSPASDPKGPPTGAAGHVSRGGSWRFESAYQRVAFRGLGSEHGKYAGQDIGFRIVLAVPDEAPPNGEANRRKPPGASPTVDLLKLLDPKRDSITGTWQLDSGQLVSNETGYAKLYINGKFPSKYTLRVQVRHESPLLDGVTFGLPCGEGFVHLVLDGWGRSISGLELIDGKGISENETSWRGRLMTSDKWYQLEIRVSPGRILIIHDGTLVLNWKGNSRRLTPHPHWITPKARMPMIGTNASVYRIRQLELDPWVDHIDDQLRPGDKIDNADKRAVD